MLLIIASLEKTLLHFASSFMKIFFLQTDLSEVEHLAVWNGGLAMERVATVQAEILMFVRGFSLKVCTNLAILEVDRHVQKRSLFSLPEGSKFDGGVVMSNALNEVA